MKLPQPNPTSTPIPFKTICVLITLATRVKLFTGRGFAPAVGPTKASLSSPRRRYAAVPAVVLCHVSSPLGAQNPEKKLQSTQVVCCDRCLLTGASCPDRILVLSRKLYWRCLPIYANGAPIATLTWPRYNTQDHCWLCSSRASLRG